jgi:hypothetical protein
MKVRVRVGLRIMWRLRGKALFIVGVDDMANPLLDGQDSRLDVNCSDIRVEESAGFLQ